MTASLNLNTTYDANFAAEIAELFGFTIEEPMSYRPKPVVKEPSGQTLPKQANAGVSLPMYVA